MTCSCIFSSTCRIASLVMGYVSARSSSVGIGPLNPFLARYISCASSFDIFPAPFWAYVFTIVLMRSTSVA